MAEPLESKYKIRMCIELGFYINVLKPRTSSALTYCFAQITQMPQPTGLLLSNSSNTYTAIQA